MSMEQPTAGPGSTSPAHVSPGALPTAPPVVPGALPTAPPVDLSREPDPVQRDFSGLAIAGFIVAFLAPPVGLGLSIGGIVTTGSNRQRGRNLAVAGVAVSILMIIVLVVGATQD